MEILVCVKKVPDASENEIVLNSEGNDIEKDDLVYSVNEFDNYAVEEALQIVDKIGGSVTVVSIGDEEAEEILRREMAMGAEKGVLLSDESFEKADGKKVASILKGYIQKNKFDLILTGAQADEGSAQVGGMLAAMLDLPFASLVNKVEAEENKLKIGREIEGGNQEISQISLPCVLSIQTGINEPRYVSIRGIRKVASVEIPTLSASDLDITEDSTLKLEKIEYFQPELGEGAEMLEGDDEQMAEKLVELLKAKGGIK